MKSRNGSYKVILLSEDELSSNQDLIYTFVDKLFSKYNDGSISDKDTATLYLLFFLKLKYKRNYFQQFKKLPESPTQESIFIKARELILFDQFEREKLGHISGLDLFRGFNLKGVPKSVCRAMENWYSNKWDIVLAFDIPSSKNLLKLQAQNKRVLTLIVDKLRVTTHILGKRDPLSFAIHDLMHADQFFNNPISQKGQLGFYKLILQFYSNDHLLNLLSNNPSFKREFEYVVSDMNAYIIHLLKSLVSTFDRIDKTSELKKLLASSNVSDDLISMILNINNHKLTNDEENSLRYFFETIY